MNQLITISLILCILFPILLKCFSKKGELVFWGQAVSMGQGLLDIWEVSREDKETFIKYLDSMGNTQDSVWCFT